MPIALARQADEMLGASDENQSSSPARAWWHLTWQDVLIAALLAGFLLSPVLTLIAHGYTPTGMAEESIGRRYFYSLRILYGEHDRPWVPQGHLVSVSHIAIQYALTAAGFPPTQLFPRIDVFAYTASILSVVVTVLAFIWAVRPISSPLGKLLVALLLLVMVFDPATTRGYHLVQADYYAWVHPIALVGVGAVLRVANAGTALGLQSGVLLGTYAAAAISIKPTYVTFVLPPAILLVNGVARREWIGVFGGALAALVTTLAGTFAVFLAYYGADVSAVVEHVEVLASVVETMDRPQRFETWLQMAMGSWQQREMIWSTVLLVPVLALSVLFLPNRAVTLSLLPSAVAAVYVAWRKFYPNTLIETNDYAFYVAVVWSALVLVPALRAVIDLVCARFRASSRLWLASLPIAGLVLAVLFGDRVARQSAEGRFDMLTSFGASTRGTRALADYLESRPGGVAFLIPDNNMRPLTVDTAIYKGGTNEIGSRWGDSPYVHAMFPERHYYVVTRDPVADPDIAQYSRIVFVRLPHEQGDDAADSRLRDQFGVSLRAYECDFRADMVYQEIVGCERQVTSLTANELQTARFLSTGGHTPPTAGSSDQLMSQDLAGLVATDRFQRPGILLWQVNPDSSVASVEGPEGARVRIEGLGMWDPDRRDFAGVDAAYSGRQWRLDTANLEASNANPRFDRTGARRQPLFGWQLEPRDALPVVERLSDEDGPFVRVHPVAKGTTIEVYGRAPLSKLDDSPVTVRAVVRLHGRGSLMLTISDVVAPGGQLVSRSANTISSDRWETLSVWLSRASFPNDGDSFSVRLSEPAEGSWMDLREVSLIEGILP